MSDTQASDWFEEHHLESTKDRKVQVSVYAVQRNYGGPEEGGWYYDTYEFTGVSERVSPNDIEATKARLDLLYADEQPRYPIGSVLSSGPEYHACIESRAGDSQMIQKPRYS